MNKTCSLLIQWMLTAPTLCCLFSNPAVAIDLGTNFRNLRRHNPDDCKFDFPDFALIVKDWLECNSLVCPQ